jgi:hypothetical protein
MTLRRALLAAVLVAAGCATTAVSSRELARLPPEDLAQVATASRSIEVAAQSLEAAQRSLDEARQLRTTATDERTAARAHLDAARANGALARRKRDDRMLRAAVADEDAAQRELLATRAKLDYANSLLELRQSRVAEGEAAVDAARADVELTKVRLLEQNGVYTRVDPRRIDAQRQRAQEKLAEARARVAQLAGETALRKQAWDDRRREARTTAAGDQSPPSPAELAPLPEMPRSDADDMGAEPDLAPSPQLEDGTAPRP